MKKKIVGVVAGVMMFSSVAFATPELEQIDLTLSESGIVTSEWAKSSVYEVYVRGLLDNTKLDSCVNMKENISREDFTEIALNYIDSKTHKFELCTMQSSEHVFSDTSNPRLERASQIGLVYGSDGKFNPQGNITREEVATILTRAERMVIGDVTIELDEILEMVYKDSSKISDWAREGVAYFTFFDILSGRDDGNFHPQDNMTREEAVSLIYRLTD